MTALRETLQEREQDDLDMLEALPVAIYTTDAAGKITYYSETPTLGEAGGVETILVVEDDDAVRAYSTGLSCPGGTQRRRGA